MKGFGNGCCIRNRLLTRINSVKGCIRCPAGDWLSPLPSSSLMLPFSIFSPLFFFPYPVEVHSSLFFNVVLLHLLFIYHCFNQHKCTPCNSGKNKINPPGQQHLLHSFQTSLRCYIHMAEKLEICVLEFISLGRFHRCRRLPVSCSLHPFEHAVIQNSSQNSKKAQDGECPAVSDP